MKRSLYFILALLAMWGGLQSRICFAQDTQEAQSNVRKVVNKVVPAYPPMARSMNLTGTVKLEVLVQAGGNAKSIQVKCGNPILVPSAQSVVNELNKEKADHETTELVEFHFNP